MAVNNNRNDEVQVTGWVGWIYFAAFILLLGGILQIISGLTALLNGGFFAISDGTVLLLDLTTWGWIHLLIGIIIICISSSLFSGRTWARVVAIILASLSFLAYFTFIGVHPIWSITVMVLDVLVIYALTVHGGEVAALAEE